MQFLTIFSCRSQRGLHPKYVIWLWCDNLCMVSSVVRTPTDSVVVQRRSKSKSYRLSYRSCLGAASRLGLTPALTGRRLNTSRRAPKSHSITVSPSQCAPCFFFPVEMCWCKSQLIYVFLVKRRGWVRSSWPCWWKRSGSCPTWLPSISSDTLSSRATPGSSRRSLPQRSSKGWRWKWRGCRATSESPSLWCRGWLRRTTTPRRSSFRWTRVRVWVIIKLETLGFNGEVGRTAGAASSSEFAEENKTNNGAWTVLEYDSLDRRNQV